MKRKTAFLLLFLCGLLSFTSATGFENLDFSGSLKTEAGVGLWYTDYSGDFTAGSLTAQGELKGYFGNSNIFVDGRLIFDATDFSSDNPEIFSAKIKEAWYLYDGSWWSIKIGRQIQLGVQQTVLRLQTFCVLLIIQCFHLKKLQIRKLELMR